MKLIKNALIYRASLPDAAALAEHLAEKPFVPVPESHYSSSGFIVHPITDELVTTFAGGFAFRLRRDFKPVSKSAIKLALTEQVAARAAELEVVGEDRTVKVSGGKVTDTWDAEWVHHLYRWKA